MNEIEILGGCIGLIVGLIIIAYWLKKRKEKQEQKQRKIAEQIERVIRANEPGYEPPGRTSMRTTIKDGVVTYRKDRRQEKDKKKSGR